MNWLVKTLTKNEFVRSWILSQARHVVTAVGATLIAKGYADQGIVEGAAGLVTLTIGFWLSHKDVQNVDKKIEVAKNEFPPNFKIIPLDTVVVRPTEISDTPSPKMTPEQEIEQTKLLNISQHSVQRVKAD